ncbi:MAG: hypothetical protein ACR2PX_18930 [Endozoicomonas sp.]|uniref:hypothetical protein n=1 Tax=Endozoicomonas sp. TaxID=1892382 RepID=UPI003D9B57E2
MAFKIEHTRIYQKLATFSHASPLAWFRGRKLTKAYSFPVRRKSLSQWLRRSRIIRRMSSKLTHVKPRLYKALGLVTRKKKLIDQRCRQHLRDAVVASMRDKPDEFMQAVFQLRKQVGQGLGLVGKPNSIEDFVSEVSRCLQDAQKTPQFIAYLQQRLQEPGSRINRLENSLKDCFEAMMAERDINPNQMMALTSARALLSELAYQTFDDKSAFKHWCQAHRESDEKMMLEINKALASIQ